MRRSLTEGVLLLATISSCATFRPLPMLFPPSRAVEEIDFEADSLNQLPTGLEPSSHGRWAVADSPTAVSGTQVVVRRGDAPSTLQVKEAIGSAAIGGEVSLRVLLGASGAGIACGTNHEGGYILKAEPAEGRVALYRGGNGGALLAAEPAAVEKGKWLRLGILCETDRVIGYFDGKPVLERTEALERANLALYADPGVTAQFDDLRYAVEGTGKMSD